MNVLIKRNSKAFERQRLPTNTLSSGSRIQRWANFIAGYSIEFVEECLENRDSEKDLVIDPFLGCGTTLVGARNLGFTGVGIEAHPLFFTLASSKLKNYTIADLDNIYQLIQVRCKKITWLTSAEIFINKMFSQEDKDKIAFASFQVQSIEESLKPLAIAMFLKACEFSCLAQTDGIYKAPSSTKKGLDFSSALYKSYMIFCEDISSDWFKEHWVKQPLPETYHQSCESLKELASASIGVCITSPPYLNNFDYAEMTRLQLYILAWAESWGDISDKVRNGLITNTTTALKGKKTIDYQLRMKEQLPLLLRNEFEGIVNSLTLQRKERAGKKEYDYLIYPYYQQINLVLTELYRVLKHDGEIHWVVADAALYGVHIKTHEHTKLLMEAIGFKDVEIRWIRKRGHRWILSKRDGAKEELGEYHLYAKK